MKIVPITELRYRNIRFDLFDIFPENWIQRKEFSLYKQTPRPCHGLFFVDTEIEASFLSADASVVTAKKGDVVFIPRGCRYSVRVEGSTDCDVDTYTVNFDLWDEEGAPIGLSDRIAVLTTRPEPRADVRLKNLADTFYRIEKREQGEARNFVKIKGDFFLLLDWIADTAEQNDDFYYPIRKGIEVFCEEWNRNERIEKYAALCGISVTYFYRCFRKWSGSSPVEYRNRLRLSNAESLLRCTNMQIKEISETVGFEDPFYFCRIFGQKFGVSPQAYRKRMRKEPSPR